MSSKVYEEAIADAKKLKEVAEENAKKAILEAVTPRIREFIEGQLLEASTPELVTERDAEMLVTYEEGGDHGPDDGSEVDEDADADEAAELEEEVVLDENALGALVNMLGGGDILDSLQEGKDVFSAALQHTVDSLSEDERQKLFSLADKINESADKLETERINNKVNSIQENDKMKEEKFYEVDLQSLRESIEAEMADLNLDEMKDADLDEEEEALMREIKLMLDLGEDVDADELPEELLSMVVDEEDEEGEDVELSDEEAPEGEDEDMGDEPLPDLMGGEPEEEMGELQEVFEIDPRVLRQELARAKRALQEGKADQQFGGKGGNAGVDGAFGGKGSGKAGVKKSFGGGAEGSDAFTNPPQLNKLHEAIRDLRRTNRAQKEKLTKYRSAVETLREQLEDLNLFNAKLLYVNKLLQNKSLTESQKKSVIKALDEANSLVETKALYKSLTESLTGTKKTLSESSRYGSSSRATTSSSSKNLTEAAGEMSRWQTLAGLK